MFCKVDAPGFEEKVPSGARRALQDKRIKFLLVRFMLYENLFEHLSGYVCFSQEWVVVPRTASSDNSPDLSNWHIGEEVRLSTGKPAFHKSWPITEPKTSTQMLKFQAAENRRLGRCWTDLLFVAPDYVDSYTTPAASSPSTRRLRTRTRR